MSFKIFKKNLIKLDNKITKLNDRLNKLYRLDRNSDSEKITKLEDKLNDLRDKERKLVGAANGDVITMELMITLFEAFYNEIKKE